MNVSPEAIGHYLISEANLFRKNRPRPSDIAAALKIKIAMDVPLGCKGWYNARHRAIHIRPTTDPDEYEQLVGHELAHLGMTEFGVPYDEQEENAYDVELTIHVPTHGARRLAQRHGFFPQMFVNFFGRFVAPSDAIRRAAQACEVTGIILTPVGQRIEVGSDIHEMNFALSPREESRLIAQANRVQDPTERETLPGVFGVQAKPYRTSKHGRGVVIFFDLDHALALGDWSPLAAQ